MYRGLAAAAAAPAFRSNRGTLRSMLSPIMFAWIEHHLAIATPLCFAALWFLFCHLASYFSGWSALARRYRLRTAFSGEQIALESGYLGRLRADYSNSLRLGADENGLYMGVMPWFGFRHRPLLVPWSEITVSAAHVNRRRRVQLGLGRELQVPLLLTPKLAGRLRAAAAGSWPDDVPRLPPRPHSPPLRWIKTG